MGGAACDGGPGACAVGLVRSRVALRIVAGAMILARFGIGVLLE